MERLIGFVDGNLEVERLESDTEDYYRGLFTGVEAAIEVYEEKPLFNCTYHPSTGKCEKKMPCFGCAASGIECEEPSPDYFKGYEYGYDLGRVYIREKNNRLEELDAPDFFWEDLECGEEFTDGFFEHNNDKWYDRGYTTGYIKGYEEAKKPDIIDEGLAEQRKFQEELEEIWDSIKTEEDDVMLSEGLEYARGYSEGYNWGFDVGYEQGVEDVHNDEVVLESEFLDLAYKLKEEIRGLALTGEPADKLPFEDLRCHNFAVYDCHHALINLVEWWAMNKVYNYWNKEKEE